MTEAAGRALGRVLRAGELVGLVGDLGAGKTCFARGVAEGAEVPREIYVSSPTFTIVNEYPGRVLIAHIDVYRLADAEELIEVGLDHYRSGAYACLIEWFDRFPEVMGSSFLELTLSVVGDEARRIDARATDALHLALLERWRGALAAGADGGAR